MKTELSQTMTASNQSLFPKSRLQFARKATYCIRHGHFQWNNTHDQGENIDVKLWNILLDVVERRKGVITGYLWLVICIQVTLNKSSENTNKNGHLHEGSLTEVQKYWRHIISMYNFKIQWGVRTNSPGVPHRLAGLTVWGVPQAIEIKLQEWKTSQILLWRLNEKLSC